MWNAYWKNSQKSPRKIGIQTSKSRETFSFNPQTSIEGYCIIGLLSLSVYNSFFNITEEKKKNKLHTNIYNECTFVELKEELKQIFNIEDITPEQLQDVKIGPLFTKFHKKLKSEKSGLDDYFILLTNYARSHFWGFESYLRIVFGPVEDDIQLKLKQYNSNFVSYEIPPGIYTNKDISEFVKKDHKGTLPIEYDGVSLKTKLILSPFVMLGFNEKSFFNTVLAFTPLWDYKPTKTIHVDNPGVDSTEKI